MQTYLITESNMTEITALNGGITPEYDVGETYFIVGSDDEVPEIVTAYDLNEKFQILKVLDTKRGRFEVEKRTGQE